MRNFISFLILLAIGYIGVNFIYIKILSYIDWDFSKIKETANFENRQYGILVLGNSTALDGVNTEMLSKSLGPAYNFSAGGASLETNFLQFNEYLKANTKPDMVLLFLSSCHTNYDKIQTINPIVEFYHSNNTLDFSMKNIPLFKFRWLFIENIKKIISQDHRDAKLVQGQLRIERITSDLTEINQSDSLSQINYEVPGYNSVFVLAQLCSSLGIKLHVFEMPCWKQNQNKFRDRLLVSHNDTINIYNLNNSMFCDSTINSRRDWLSENHLNYFGSIVVTKKIISLLKK